MRVISRKKLQDFWQADPNADESLKTWYFEAEHAQWKKPEDIKQRYSSADILPGNRVVFNIKGNHYRLIVKIHYNTGVVYVRFVGTHAEYSKINAETI
jgi:mRNA interferase HigB